MSEEWITLSTIEQINHYSLDSAVCFLNTYLLDSTIHPSNNLGQINFYAADKC